MTLIYIIQYNTMQHNPRRHRYYTSLHHISNRNTLYHTTLHTQHSTVQYSTAQHDTPHSTVHHSIPHYNAPLKRKVVFLSYTARQNCFCMVVRATSMMISSLGGRLFSTSSFTLINKRNGYNMSQCNGGRGIKVGIEKRSE